MALNEDEDRQAREIAKMLIDAFDERSFRIDAPDDRRNAIAIAALKLAQNELGRR